MAIEIFNRYEIKYFVSDEIFPQIRSRLEEYMEADANMKNDGFYRICNIYYDTPSHEIIRRSIEKPAYKEKIRLRSYGKVGLKDKVYLEIKKKFMGQVNKRRTSIQLDEAYQYISSKVKPEAKPYMNLQVLNEIDYLLYKYQNLQPMLYLSYDRYAMFGKEDPNLRVTFDTNIRTRRYDLGLDKGNHGDLLLPTDVWLMEVKVDKAAPLWFAKLLSEFRLYPISFSKYGTEYQKSILHKEITSNINIA